MQEQDKILTEYEYRQNQEAPFRWAEVKKLFRTWERALSTIKDAYPKEYEELSNKKASSGIKEKLQKASERSKAVGA